MKIHLIILLGLLTTFVAFGQENTEKKTTSNLIRISSETIDNFELTIYYSTFSNHFDINDYSGNINSYLDYAKELPSLIFGVHQGATSRYAIMPRQKQSGDAISHYFQVIKTADDERQEIECGVDGDICELRVEELIKLGVDSSAKVVHSDNGDVFQFKGTELEIQSFEELKSEAIEIAKRLMNYHTDYRENTSWIYTK